MSAEFQLGKAVGRGQVRLRELKDAQERIRKLEVRVKQLEEALRWIAAGKTGSFGSAVALANEALDAEAL